MTPIAERPITGESHEDPSTHKKSSKPPPFHRRLGRPHHYERRRDGPDPALAGKARGGRAGGSDEQSGRPTRRRHGGPKPDLVRTEHRAHRHRRSALGSPSG